MKDKILYFGYGANRDIRVMKAITGSKNLKGTPATLKGFGLYVQRLDQTPDAIFPSSPVPISVQQLLRESWNDRFTTYIIKTKEGSEVFGTIWELTSQERELVREWELVEFGWYKDYKNVKAVTKMGKEIEAETEGWREGQETDHEIDGKKYPTFLNRVEDFEKVAEKARREYFERIGNQEGSLPTAERS